LGVLLQLFICDRWPGEAVDDLDTARTTWAIARHTP
jgi:hypothetical protein